MTTLSVTLKGDDKQLTGKPLLKRTMKIWIGATDTLLAMIVTLSVTLKASRRHLFDNLCRERRRGPATSFRSHHELAAALRAGGSSGEAYGILYPLRARFSERVKSH